MSTCSGRVPLGAGSTLRPGSGVPTDVALGRACATLRRGEIAQALDLLHELSADLSPLDRAHALAAEVDAHVARGELSEAMALAEPLAMIALDDTLPRTARGVSHLARGELAAAVGDAHTAALLLEVTGSLVPDPDPDWVPWRAGLALALARTGRAGEAGEVAARHVEHARHHGSVHALAGALRAQASATVAADRVAVLQEALEVLDGGGFPRLEAQVATDLAGQLLLRPDRVGDAITLLRPAEEYAGRHDLRPLLGRIRRLLELAGEQPRVLCADALDTLTRAERRVAVLASRGLTNREVAEELVVTVKAVEWHLSHIYRKLGIRSRTALRCLAP